MIRVSQGKKKKGVRRSEVCSPVVRQGVLHELRKISDQASYPILDFLIEIYLLSLANKMTLSAIDPPQNPPSLAR